jgi:NAD(P)-dependent dehydrogenase (short-subunit alcohol dehydrogenase family)
LTAGASVAEPQSPIVQIHGAAGSIGGALCASFLREGWRVTAVSRSARNPEECGDCEWLQWEVGGPDDALAPPARQFYRAVVWAQGMNFNDDIFTFSRERHAEMYEANVVHVMESLNVLLRNGWLMNGAKLCVVSSIWQRLARQNKMSYCVTKAALQGLVGSLAVDLGGRGILVNAVLPGALDTPMTRANLTPAQIRNLAAMTPLGSLPSLDDVCGLAYFLCSQANTGVTGQFIEADRGFTHARIL